MPEEQPAHGERSERILILAPFGRDASLAKQILEQAQLVAEVCADVEALDAALQAGAGVLLLTQEALSPESARTLADALAQQPAWSDLPVLVLISGGHAAPSLPGLEPLAASGANVSLLERPVRAATLVSATQTALRARRRQYELRDQLRALRQAEAEQRRALDVAQANQRRLRVLVDVTAAFTHASRDLSTLLDLIVRRVSEVIGDGGALYSVRPDGQTLGLDALYDPDPAQAAALRTAVTNAPLRVGEGISGRVVRTGKPINVAELDRAAYAATLPPGPRTTFDGLTIHSMLAVPVGVSGRALGTLVLWRTASGRPYTAEDQALLQELADRAALAIDNARLFREVEEQAEIHAQLNAALRATGIERDRALAQAEADRARLQELFRQVPGAVAITRGPGHGVDFANALYFRIAGYRRPEELLGRSLAELHDPGLIGVVERAYRSGEAQLLVEQPVRFDRRGDGALDEGLFNFIFQPYRDAEGQVEGIILHATEVTALVRARERTRHLQELTVQLSHRQDADVLFAHIVDAVAELLDVPVAGLYLLEQPEADFVGVAVRGSQLAGVGSRLPRHGSLAGRAVDQRRSAAVDDASQLQDVVLPPPVIGARVGAAAVAPILADGEALGAIEVYSPGPRHWRSDDLELLAAFAAAAAAAISNARLAERERQMLQARDDFLAAASHDLKNPLTAIRGATQLLERSLARGGSVPPERLTASLRTIGGAAARMTNQIDELLDVARAHRGEPLQLDRTPTDLVGVVRQLAATHQASSEHHTVELQTSLPELVGAWDSRRVARAIENLLSNAIKYSPAGGRVTLWVGREDDTALVQVRDRGIGIPAADLPHVLERFRRGANVLGRIEGTGIGLAAAAQIIQQHGGRIELDSREGAGTTVNVRLPLTEPPTQPSGDSSAAALRLVKPPPPAPSPDLRGRG